MESIGSTEQVIDRFSNPDLVPHDFVSQYLPKYRPSEPLDKLHSSASQLLSQLDHHSQDLTFQLESLTAELMRASKKVSYEVELLKSDVSTLALDVKKVGNNHMAKIVSTDLTTVERLKRLDMVRSRMVDVQKVFERARAFDEGKVTEKVLSLANDGSLKEAIKEIDDAAELCQIWKGTSLYQSRQKFIQNLRKKLEAIINEKTHSTQISRTNTPVADHPSRTSTPMSEDSYYGSFLGQFTKRFG